MRTKESNTIQIALLLNRIGLGLLFAFAGIRKVLPFEKVDNWSSIKSFAGLRQIASTLFKPADIGQKLNDFAAFSASKAPLPELLGKAYGYALPWTELVFGVLLFIGVYTRVSATVIALLLLSFLIAMGPEWWPDQGPAFSKNFILLSLALLFAAAGSGRFAFKPDGQLK